MRRTVVVLCSLALTACAGGGAPAGSPDPQPAASAAPARPAGDPTTLTYGVGAARYRLHVEQQQSQDMQGQITEINSTQTLLVSATQALAGMNVAVDYTIDSVAVEASGPLAAQIEQLRTLQGRSYHVVFSPLGRPVSITPPDSSAFAEQVGESFRDFLPDLPSGPIRPGLVWVDTAVRDQGRSGLELQARSVRTHTVVGWETYEGTRALHITLRRAYTVTGAGNQNGVDISIEGGGVATSDRYISATGLFLGQTARDSSQLIATVPAMALDIPISSMTRSSVTRLP